MAVHPYNEIFTEMQASMDALTGKEAKNSLKDLSDMEFQNRPK